MKVSLRHERGIAYLSVARGPSWGQEQFAAARDDVSDSGSAIEAT
jgi:hypothetical protein